MEVRWPEWAKSTPEAMLGAQLHVPVPVSAIVLCFVLPVPALLYWLFEHVVHARRSVIDEQRQALIAATGTSSEAPPPEDEPSVGDEPPPLQDLERSVLFASLEHSLSFLPCGRVVAGGLGKVAELISRYHPGDLIMVHPMIGSNIDGGAYRPTDPSVQLAEDEPVVVKVDDCDEIVRVFHSSSYPSGPQGIRVDILLLSHRLFLKRGKDTIYPNPMTQRTVQGFYSLWNQAVGALIVRHRPDILHCPDFHTAVAPWYALPEVPHLRMLLVLHNAEYQGEIASDMILGEKLEIIASIWNMPKAAAAKHLVYQGRFNMLKSGVDFLMERQRGRGAYAVSSQYAKECHLRFSILWPLPPIGGIENPMLEEERTVFKDSLEAAKARAKLEIQPMCGLRQDPNARIFVFLGRMVRQKGVDLLADIAPWLLTTFPEVQLMVIGPVGDGYGAYAKVRFEELQEQEEFAGRLFVRCEFWRPPPSLKLATDFCVMPSRDEPFGYVDIEFAWCGAVMVGAQMGKEGKVPGFYYKAQNRDNLKRLRRELQSVITLAMKADASRLHNMSLKAIECDFPLRQWQNRLQGAYRAVLPDSEVLLRTSRGHHQVAMQGNAPAVAPLEQPLQGDPDMSPEPPSLKDARKDSRRDMMAIAVADQRSLHLPADREFLTQDLSDEEIALRVRQKMSTQPYLNIDQIIEAIGVDVRREAERDPWSLWLLEPFLGELRVHWLVCLGYVSAFASPLLTTAIAMHWGDRTSGKRGEAMVYELMIFGKDAQMPLSWLPSVIMTTQSVAYAIGAPLWALAAKHVEPRRLLAANLFLKPMLLLVIAPLKPNARVGLALVFLQGLISSGSLLFVVFNFLISVKGDMSRVVLRMGLLEMMRYFTTWTITAYTYAAAPTRQEKENQSMWTSWHLTGLLLPIALVVLVTTVVPGVLLLWAPGPYRSDRFPGWDLRLAFTMKTFVFLALAEIVGSLGEYPSNYFLSWSRTNNWSSADVGLFCFAFSVCFLMCTVWWSRFLSRASEHGNSLLIGIVVLLAPPAILRAVVLEEVSTYNFIESSNWAMLVCAISVFFDGVRSACIWAAQIRVLNSRWRLLSYASIISSVMHILAGFSPWLCEELIAKTHNASFNSTSQKQIADAMIVCLVPICTCQFFLQASAIPFIRRDMGVVQAEAVGSTTNQESWVWRHRYHGGYVSWVLIFFAIATSAFHFYGDATRPLDKVIVRRCHLGGAPNCLILDHEMDAKKYGLNSYGQPTTAHRRCLQQMREKNGDTFSYRPGNCTVYRCHTEPKALQSARENSADEVWSAFCPISGRNLVVAQLHEWSWNDVAHECEQYLGPAGFDGVQISPPTEHVKGDGWFVKYQLVSYKLESRSGTEEEFVHMVDMCTKAGVGVIVDYVANQMANTWISSPSKYVGMECGPGPATLPCEGWNGSTYGQREFVNCDPPFARRHFHHYPGDETANCAMPPWPNNLVVCDLYGLPDLNTEHLQTQAMMSAFLRKLHDIGVTMLRMDAARHIFPESVQMIVMDVPWDWLLMETYADFAYTSQEAFDKFVSMGHVYDTERAKMITSVLHDPFDEQTHSYRCLTQGFARLLEMKSEVPDCQSSVCKTPAPNEAALEFLDNHDSQRNRWFSMVKHGLTGQPPPMCDWDTEAKIEDCVLNYKYGALYHIAMAYLLVMPYGDAVRLMSSYAFFHFSQGPPGVRPDSLHDPVLPVYTFQEGVGWKPTRCRSTPSTTPVKADYDNDQERPWVCEHRWLGVSGLLRFRKLIMGRNQPMHSTWSDQDGNIGFSLGNEGFVALSKGKNWYSKCGSDKARDLATLVTGMPEGLYCNLASIMGPVPKPGGWRKEQCNVDAVVVGKGGRIARGTLPSGGVVALHVVYTAATADGSPPEPEPITTGSPKSDFWGWRENDEAVSGTAAVSQQELGCCYAISVGWQGDPCCLETEKDVPKEACMRKLSGGDVHTQSKDKDRHLNWNQLRCPNSADEAFDWLKHAEEYSNATHTLPLGHSSARETLVVGILIIMVEACICTTVLCGRDCHREKDLRSAPVSPNLGSPAMGIPPSSPAGGPAGVPGAGRSGSTIEMTSTLYMH